MKKAWKVLLIMTGILAVVGLACFVVGYCLGGMEQAYQIVEGEISGKGDGIGRKETEAEIEKWPEEWPVIREDHYENPELATADQISQLRMELNRCQVTIEKTESDFYGITADNVKAAQYYREGDTLIVRTAKGNRSKENLTLYIPESSQLSVTEIEIGGGDFTAKNLHTDVLLLQAGGVSFVVDGLEADRAEIQAGAGNIEIRDGKLTELVTEMGAGNLFYRGSIEREAEVTCAMGAVQMEIAGREEDFDYETEGSMGVITVNGVSMPGRHEWKNSGNKQMELTCSMGEIEVTFYEDGGNENEQ